MNIFIVEDELLFLVSLKHLVKELGHVVVGTAASYEEAIQKLKKNPIDVILSDIILEGELTGIDLARYIRQNIRVPVIFQTSVTTIAMIREARDLSPYAYLQKPVDKRALAQALATIRPAE